MAGITSYGAYIPLWRLGRETQGWNFPVEKAVASYDEDSITMAVAAGLDCLKNQDRSLVDALYFASTTSPFDEKQAAAIVATAADLRRDIFATDLGSSLRGGTIALKTAFDAVKAGTAKKVLVTATDTRVARPRSEFEASFGDGAVAFLIGDENVAVEVEAFHSLSDEIYDVWRTERDSYVRSWEDRFVLDEGYLKVMPEAISSLLAKCHLTAKDFTKAIFYGPDARRHSDMARRLGFDPETQIQDPLFSRMGNTGAAFALMLLAAALEEAKPGDRFLLANYGNGADALILKVTEAIEKTRGRRGIKKHLESKRILKDYQTYLRFKGLLDVAPGARRPANPSPSASALWRERDQNIRFYGTKCKRCGYPQFPAERVCTKCQAKDEMEPYRFSDKKANLFTHADDYLVPIPDPPLVVTVINFEGGGRMMGTMTDRVIEEISLGMPLEMTFRKLEYTSGIPNYFWKCMPERAVQEV